MRSYRGPSGDQRLWFDDGEIDTIMEAELCRAGLMPEIDGLPVDIEAFVEDHLEATLDQYAELPGAILGLTEFAPGAVPAIQLNRDLTGSAMDAEWCPPGIAGRWRATLAHEGAHVVLHRSLFDIDQGQTSLFEVAEPTDDRLLRCLKRDVVYRGGSSDWREVQANRGMAALLMPKPLFLDAARSRLHDSRPSSIEAATRDLARVFAVSREATAIRLSTLGFRANDGSDLFGDDNPEPPASPNPISER